MVVVVCRHLRLRLNFGTFVLPWIKYSLNSGNVVHIIFIIIIIIIIIMQYNVSELDSYTRVHFVVHIAVEYCVPV